MKGKLFAIVIQIVIVLIIIILITFIIRESERYKLRKRISKYTINKNNNNISIYDKVISNYNNVLKKLRTPIKKVLPTLVKRYDKYVIGEGCGEDIITNKFVLALIITVLYIIVSIFKKVKISLLFILLVFIIGFYIYDIILIIIKKIRCKTIDNDMLRAVIIMNNAFKSGKSTIQAVKIVSEKLDGTLKYEFKKIYSEMCYGLTIESAFDRFSKRVKVESSVYISSSLITLSKTGGNIVKVFDYIEKTLYDKKKLESELKSTTMVSNLVVKILMIIPLVNVFLLYILNPSYFSPLFESPLGYFVIFIIVMLFTIYVIVLNRMLKVKY